MVHIHPKKVTIQAGESVILTCKSPIDRRAVVKWRRSGSYFEDWPKNFIINRNILVIHDASSGNSGTFNCFISLTTPFEHQYSFRASSTVIVHDSNETKIPQKLKSTQPPQITISSNSQNITVNEGDEFELMCTANGSPLPRVQWKRLDETLIRNIPFFIENVGFFRKSEVKASDGGVYVCTATNEVGESKAYVTILIQLKPPKQYKVTEGKQLKISCDVEQLDEPLSWRRQDGLILPNSSRVLDNDLVSGFGIHRRANMQIFLQFRSLEKKNIRETVQEREQFQHRNSFEQFVNRVFLESKQNEFLINRELNFSDF